ncbi:MAG UNVERIFIED_CONTAM: hypothetical protein LVR18_47195 [Planctomycetaceae bacterium]
MKVELWGQTNFAGDKWVLGQGDFRNDWIRSVKIYQYFDETHTIMEPVVDWDMHWKSTWSDIYDTRSRYFYQWVSLSHDIYGKRPRYETVTVDAKVVQSKFITKWGSEEILTPQTVLKPARVQSSEEVPFGEFIVDAISAGQDVLINTRGAATIGGKLSAAHGQLSITTSSSLSVNGLQPGISASADAIAAPATLRSPVTVTLNAAGEINIGESAVVSSTGIGGGEGRILINTTDQAVLSGEFEAFDDVVVNAASSITLDGRITAGNLIDINAGQSTAGSGSVNGTFFAELVTQNPGSEVTLSAGALSGSISLVNSSISADIRVSLAAPAGSISHGPGETITANLVQARAATGIEARTNAPEVDFATSAAGGITLTNLQALTAVVTAANGPVDITSMGTLTAAQVAALGSSAANSVTLRAETPVASEKSHLFIGNLTSSPAGNIMLTARGTVSGVDGVIRGNRLVVQGDTIPELTTEINSVSLTTLEPGSVRLTQFGSQPLTIDALIRDGAFVVDHGAGRCHAERHHHRHKLR